MPESGAHAMARFIDVYKAFSDVRVLNGLSLDIAPGEKVAIIGPSGSGKSTLLRLLMTLETPTSGVIEVEGEVLWQPGDDGECVPVSREQLRRLRARIGMVFQHFNLFPHMTALDNLTVGPRRVLGFDRGQAEARADELLGMVGLADKSAVYPAQLSGGQKQRVAIARALAMEPDMLLFDEVTSALDPELVGEVLAVLRQIATQTDMTMVLVTHEMDFAREIADRVVFIDGGVVVEQGPPSAVLNAPQEPRTQAFLRAVLDPAHAEGPARESDA